MKVGIEVTCTVCGKRKAPFGRSVHAVVYPSYCTFECGGYLLEPEPGNLWPGETEKEFGYTCSENATKEVSVGWRDVVKLVSQQAEDEGLWFVAQTAPEAYLQQELRKLHEAIELAVKDAE